MAIHTKNFTLSDLRALAAKELTRVKGWQVKPHEIYFDRMILLEVGEEAQPPGVYPSKLTSKTVAVYKRAGHRDDKTFGEDSTTIELSIEDFQKLVMETAPYLKRSNYVIDILATQHDFEGGINKGEPAPIQTLARSNNFEGLRVKQQPKNFTPR